MLGSCTNGGTVLSKFGGLQNGTLSSLGCLFADHILILTSIVPPEFSLPKSRTTCLILFANLLSFQLNESFPFHASVAPLVCYFEYTLWVN